MFSNTLRYLFRISLFVPAILWGYQIYSGTVGADPAKELNHQAGEFALYLLLANALIGLAIFYRLKIPLAFRWVYAQRRWLGVMSFLYLCAHLFFYLALEGFESQAFSQLVTKTYLIFGLSAWIVMAILAVTSNDLSVRFLKTKIWKRIHRFVYLGFIFLSVHILLIEKTDLIKYGSLILIFWILQVSRYFVARMQKRSF